MVHLVLQTMVMLEVLALMVLQILQVDLHLVILELRGKVVDFLTHHHAILVLAIIMVDLVVMAEMLVMVV
jgi:hypothetical protein